MRTDRSVWSWLLAWAALSVLPGCPGKLDNQELYLAALGDAGAGAPNAGTGGGTAGDANAGGPSAGSAGSDMGACGDVVARIFEPSCGGTGCHGSIAPQQDLDLVSDGVASRVVGVPGKGCLVTLADPASPEASLIYEKLSATPPCGAPMPLARPPLSSADAACVLDWIAAQQPL